MRQQRLGCYRRLACPLSDLDLTKRAYPLHLYRLPLPGTESSISARLQADKNDAVMKKPTEPSDESLALPEIDDQRFRRRPGRGHRTARSVGEVVTIEADLWSHSFATGVT